MPQLRFILASQHFLIRARRMETVAGSTHDALEGSTESGKPMHASLSLVNLHSIQAGWYGTRRMLPILTKQCRDRLTQL